MMLMVGRIFGFFLALISSEIATHSAYGTVALLAFTLLVAAVLSLFIKEDLKRYKFSQQQDDNLNRLANRYSYV
jgi:hypothetical protein